MTEQRLQEISLRLQSVSVEIRSLQKEEQDLRVEKETILMQLRDEDKEKRKENLLKRSFPWTKLLNLKLKQIFRLDSFRANQENIINCILSKENCFVIMPTGGGKSLCYQLSATMMRGFTIVITPLISLMQDQCYELKKLGVPCSMLYSGTPEEEKKEILSRMKQTPGPEDRTHEKLIFISPEQLVNSKRILSVLEECYKLKQLHLIVVDEAHCCSEWGHDFRPDYKKLAICKILFPDTPLVALTATASPKVQKDVEKLLNIPHSITFSSSVNRANLFYTIRPKLAVNNVPIQIINFISEIQGGLVDGENPIGIVYCLSKKDTEDVSTYLNEAGYLSCSYHAGLTTARREQVHLSWRNESIHIVVATTAFGLGINKANVRFVLHHTISKSLEAYYQESGRAGRDGNFATCCALFRPSDIAKLSSMVYYQHDAVEKLFKMCSYANTLSLCRKSSILNHFGEPSQKQVICCDVCSMTDMNYVEQNLAECVKSMFPLLQFLSKTEQNVTFAKLAQLWKGNQRKAISAPASLPKAPSSFSLYQCEQIVSEMLHARALQFHYHNTSYTTISYVIASKELVQMDDHTREQCYCYNVNLFLAPETKSIPSKTKKKDQLKKSFTKKVPKAKKQKERPVATSFIDLSAED